MKSRKFLTAALVYIFIILFGACNEDKQKSSELRKLNKNEVMSMFVNKKFNTLENVIHRNSNGDILPEDSLQKYRKLTDQVIPDFYVNDSGRIIEIVFRPTDKEDLLFLQELRDSVKTLMTGAYKVELVDVNCDSLDSILKNVHKSDQMNRSGSGIDSSIDRKNISVVVSILEKCGMPCESEESIDDIGTIWLVLQHSNNHLREKYLPLLQDAANHGYLDRGKLALMEDRILVEQGKPQIYGSQVYKDENGSWQVSTITNPSEVDKRRSEVGLGPLKEYLARWDINYQY